ncbi:hypothetical protein [Streptomyces sp. NRRL S-920]|uniref:hypothetical protein n=1 Tax=Streptomyces sp. NRRL S-920 TaxID=1463921 RepID=UPI0004C9FF22|nr:hypothetical protein [Streptomyces sp. NRRL S-920]
MLALLAALALVGCTSSTQVDAPRPGTALAADGAQSSGVVGNKHAHVGDVWYFALPVPNNTSANPIEITEVSVQHIPSGVKVLSYGAYDLEDTEGLPILTKKNGPHTPDFEKLKNYAAEPVKVAARAESDIFYLAEMRITAPPKDSARKCRFAYNQGGQAYTQALDCEVELKVGK